MAWQLQPLGISEPQSCQCFPLTHPLLTAEYTDCWVALPNRVPLPGSFATWQFADSCAKQQGAFSFGASVREPGTRFLFSLFSVFPPGALFCLFPLPFSLFSTTSFCTSPLEFRTFLFASQPRDQKVKLPTLTEVCSQAGEVIESSVQMGSGG